MDSCRVSLLAWCLFLLVDGAASLSPGPSVLLVTSRALRGGVRGALGPTLGILGVNLAFFALSIAGLGAVLATSVQLFQALKWAGAAYLVFLGLKGLLGRGGMTELAVAPSQNRARGLADGMLLQAANPKALLYYVSILPQFVPARPTISVLALLALTSMVTELFILLGYAAAAHRAGRWLARPLFSRWLDRVAGALMLAAGVKVATQRT